MSWKVFLYISAAFDLLFMAFFKIAEIFGSELAGNAFDSLSWRAPLYIAVFAVIEAIEKKA